MNLFLKMIAVPTIILSATSSFAGTQMTCKSLESINTASGPTSVQTAKAVLLYEPNLNAAINLEFAQLNLKARVVTFLSKLTSPGEQVVIVTVKDAQSGSTFSSNGHGQVESFVNTAKGSLAIHCSIP